MQFRMTTLLTCTIALLVTAPAAHAATPAATAAKDRVLLVISSYGADEGKTRPGFEMDELTQAYVIFKDNGLQVEIASPAGGAVVADQYNRNKPYNNRFLTEVEVLGWARQLCDALEYMHSQESPVLHRDSKPSNIKLAPSGLIKLVDFGLVKLMSTDSTQTITVLQGRGTAASDLSPPYR